MGSTAFETGRTSDAILEMRDVSVRFDMDRGEAKVIDDVDLDIKREEVLGVVGESGSGKSMLASAMLDAVVDPGQTSGSVRYHPEDGEPIDVLSLTPSELRRVRWEKISMVFQGAMSSFNPTMRIRDQFEETLDAHERDVREGMQRARELIAGLYMDPDRVLESFPHELSGGMKQRTLIALSLILEPEILIMDEPTASLDLLMQRSILNLLRQLKERYELTLVFITHDLPLVARIADRLSVLYAFQIAEVGPTEDILRDAAHPYTRMLLKATPNLDAPIDEMRPIAGSSPDPVNVPSGCSYHPRCPLADETCEANDPQLMSVDDDHAVACFYSEQAADAVPFDLEAAVEANDGSVVQRTGRTSNVEGDSDSLVELDDVTIAFEQGGLLNRLNIFDDPDVVRAVDGVSLEIPEDDVIALVGESGCGKTTLGKSVIGIHRPESGSINYRGQDMWAARDGTGEVEIPFEEIRRSLQIIHQDPGSALNPNKRVISTLLKPLKKWQRDLSQRERERRIYLMLEEVGMEPARDYAQRYPHQLSGGEQQRVALVRALLMNPDLVLADEAISALDVSLRVEMMDLMLDLQDVFNTSFLFISHDLSNARYLAEKSGGRIGVMYLGEIVEVGPVDAVINNPDHPYTQVLRWATPDLDLSKEVTDPPVRDIDIPDPVNPPSGCRFHTRCPEAREICRNTAPDPIETELGKEVSCFRVDEQHEYWESNSITDEGPHPAPSVAEPTESD